MTETHRVIGTAGHIDHGKTSLIRALTGTDLDRLPEEKNRGITITLGFIHHSLPSGRVVSFVDVPGHERLVRTMIAGATGLDAVMLCISASEGVMQTKEHLDILQLLGLEQGIVALTMCDLVDEETIELAEMEVEDLIAGTFLENAPIVRTSALDSASTLAPLQSAIEQLCWSPRTNQGPFRLPVDRAFIQRGFGTVVTGTVRSGSLQDGSEIHILPAEITARVRGMQVHGQDVRSTQSGLRTALNLAGVERDDLARGMVITEGHLPPASILDSRIQLLPGKTGLHDGMRVRLLQGTAEVMAVCTVISNERGETVDAVESGERAIVQLRTEAPLVALPGDRFILRRESPLDTLGGGTILDPWSRRVRRKDKDVAHVQLHDIEQGVRAVHLRRAGFNGLSTEQRALYQAENEGRQLGERWFDSTLTQSLEDQLLRWLETWHHDHPLALGCPRAELIGSGIPHMEKRAVDDLLFQLIEREQLVADGPRIRRAGFTVRLTPTQQARLSQLERQILEMGCATPKLDELLPQDPELIPLLMNRDQLIRVADRLVHHQALDNLKQDVLHFFDENEEMGPAEFKELTGLSRRHAIPLLEWLDTQGVTVRKGNARIRKSK